MARLDQLPKHMQMRILFLPEKEHSEYFLPTPLFCLCSDLFTPWWEEIVASSCQPLSLEMSDLLILPAKKHQYENQRNIMNIMFKRYLSLQMYFLIIYPQYSNSPSLGFLFSCFVSLLLSDTWKMHSSAKCKNSNWLDYPNVCKPLLRQAWVHIYFCFSLLELILIQFWEPQYQSKKKD